MTEVDQVSALRRNQASASNVSHCLQDDDQGAEINGHGIMGQFGTGRLCRPNTRLNTLRANN